MARGAQTAAIDDPHPRVRRGVGDRPRIAGCSKLRCAARYAPRCAHVEKVTISLPGELAQRIDQRRAESGEGRSQVVADLCWRGWYQWDDERRAQQSESAYSAVPETVGDQVWAEAAADTMAAWEPMGRPGDPCGSRGGTGRGHRQGPAPGGRAGSVGLHLGAAPGPGASPASTCSGLRCGGRRGRPPTPSCPAAQLGRRPEPPDADHHLRGDDDGARPRRRSFSGRPAEAGSV